MSLGLDYASSRPFLTWWYWNAVFSQIDFGHTPIRMLNIWDVVRFLYYINLCDQEAGFALQSVILQKEKKEIKTSIWHPASVGREVTVIIIPTKRKWNKNRALHKPASYTTFILLFKENRHDEHFPNSKLASLVNTWPSVTPTVIFCGVKQF